jgi:hypothetical protein
MREVVDDTATAARRAERARADMAALAASDAGAAFVRERVAALRAARRQRADAPSVPDGPVPAPDPSGRNDLVDDADSPVADPPASPPPPAGAREAEPDGPPAGLGPIRLPPPPTGAPVPPGFRGRLRRLVARSIAYETDRRDERDAARDAQFVELIEQTRRAVSAVRDDGRRQAATFDEWTAHVAGAIRHLEALQSAHDAMVEGQTRMHVELGTRQAALDEQLRTGLSDLSADLARLQARVAELTVALEALAARVGRTTTAG